jgi:phosphohistidine phosphatase
MKLIIMRHGDADTFGLKDKDRCLTPNGIKQARAAGEWLSGYLGQETSFDYALVSSFARAEQTYQEVQNIVLSEQKHVSDDVIPSGNPQIAHDFIRTLMEQNKQWKTVLVVSHMPFVSYFLEEITVNQYSMLFDTSSIAVIDYDIQTGAGLVETVYHPTSD